MSLSIGRIVHYMLTRDDAAAINKRRADARNNHKIRNNYGLGSQVHFGTEHVYGQRLPMIVTKAWQRTGDDKKEIWFANGQVFLDGNDTLFVQGVVIGDQPGNIAWPQVGK